MGSAVVIDTASEKDTVIGLLPESLVARARKVSVICGICPPSLTVY